MYIVYCVWFHSSFRTPRCARSCEHTRLWSSILYNPRFTNANSFTTSTVKISLWRYKFFWFTNVDSVTIWNRPASGQSTLGGNRIRGTNDKNSLRTNYGNTSRHDRKHNLNGITKNVNIFIPWNYMYMYIYVDSIDASHTRHELYSLLPKQYLSLESKLLDGSLVEFQIGRIVRENRRDGGIIRWDIGQW